MPLLEDSGIQSVSLAQLRHRVCKQITNISTFVEDATGDSLKVLVNPRNNSWIILCSQRSTEWSTKLFIRRYRVLTLKKRCDGLWRSWCLGPILCAVWQQGPSTRPQSSLQWPYLWNKRLGSALSWLLIWRNNARILQRQLIISGLREKSAYRLSRIALADRWGLLSTSVIRTLPIWKRTLCLRLQKSRMDIIMKNVTGMGKTYNVVPAVIIVLNHPRCVCD